VWVGNCLLLDHLKDLFNFDSMQHLLSLELFEVKTTLEALYEFVVISLEHQLKQRFD
jgi:hypothetical protein